MIVVQPGLERFAQDELNVIGICQMMRIKGALLCKGHLTTLMRINLHCRTVSRVLVTLGKFRATNFRQLAAGLAGLPWDEFINREGLSGDLFLCLRVSSYRSDLYHEKAVTLRIIQFLSEHFNCIIPVQSTVADEQTQLVVVHIKQDRIEVRLDSSGIHLHKRGYSKITEKAPLRETIAAAMLQASGWRESGLDLLDPMCGSGTIPIEAALMKQGRTWDRFRRFAFMDWARFDPILMAKARSTLPDTDLLSGSIRAADLNPKVINTCIENRRRAGTDDYFSAICQPLDHWLDQDLRRTIIVTNPPWGIRLDSGDWERVMKKLRSRTAAIYLLIPNNVLPRIKPHKTIFQTRCGEIDATFCLL